MIFFSFIVQTFLNILCKFLSKSKFDSPPVFIVISCIIAICISLCVQIKYFKSNQYDYQASGAFKFEHHVCDELENISNYGQEVFKVVNDKDDANDEEDIPLIVFQVPNEECILNVYLIILGFTSGFLCGCSSKLWC